MHDVLSHRARRLEQLAAHPRTPTPTRERIARVLSRPEAVLQAD